VIDISESFKKGLMAETRNKSVYNKEALWTYLDNYSLECLDLDILEHYYHNEIITIIFPKTLGEFVKDIAGNSISIAIWLLQYQVKKYDPLFEYEKREKVLHNLNILIRLELEINNAKETPDKHPFTPTSSIKEWSKILNFYNQNKTPTSIHWDIDGDHRLKNFPAPKAKKLKKKLLLGRCLLCHRKQTEKTIFCDVHKSDINSKQKSKRWIKEAYKYGLKNNFTKDHHELNIFSKSYELHTWVKWHPIQKEFRSLVKEKFEIIYLKNPSISYLSPVKSSGILFELEKIYHSHPYINEFETRIDFNLYSIIDAYHSLILESEHTIIKVLSSKRLRQKYQFVESSSKELKVKYRNI
jgi:hypothetical protein